MPARVQRMPNQAKYTEPITKPDKPKLVTPFDDLLTSKSGQPIRELQAWRQKRMDILKRFRETLGEPPDEKPPLEPEYLAETDCGSYTRTELQYRVHCDEWARAFLCIPKEQDRPLPAVLCLQQTCDQGRREVVGLAGNKANAYGRDLAIRGFVTLCPDHFVAGRRIPPEGSFSTEGFYRRFPRWSAVGKAIWEEQIAVDLLQSLPEVDADCIGCMGHSLGGHGSAFLAASDERIRCAVGNCGVTSFRCNPRRTHWSRDGWYIYFPKLRSLFLEGKPAPFDFHELIAGIAPRAFLGISTLREPSFDGQEHVPGMFLRIHEVYELCDAADRIAHYMHNCGHGFSHHSRNLAYAWLETWLMDRQ